MLKIVLNKLEQRKLFLLVISVCVIIFGIVNGYFLSQNLNIIANQNVVNSFYLGVSKTHSMLDTVIMCWSSIVLLAFFILLSIVLFIDSIIKLKELDNGLEVNNNDDYKNLNLFNQTIILVVIDFIIIIVQGILFTFCYVASSLSFGITHFPVPALILSVLSKMLIPIFFLIFSTLLITIKHKFFYISCVYFLISVFINLLTFNVRTPSFIKNISIVYWLSDVFVTPSQILTHIIIIVLCIVMLILTKKVCETDEQAIDK
jgi:hypothetical protein